MSMRKRHIELDPSATLAEVTRLFDEGRDDLEVKVGDRLFLVHEADVSSEANEQPQKINAIDAMSEFFGSWEGRPEIDQYLEWREKQREYDIERHRRLYK